MKRVVVYIISTLLLQAAILIPIGTKVMYKDVKVDFKGPEKYKSVYIFERNTDSPYLEVTTTDGEKTRIDVTKEQANFYYKNGYFHGKWHQVNHGWFMFYIIVVISLISWDIYSNIIVLCEYKEYNRIGSRFTAGGLKSKFFNYLELKPPYDFTPVVNGWNSLTKGFIEFWGYGEKEPDTTEEVVEENVENSSEETKE